ncbi:MAG: tetratricopeptide repeat protein, partial [Candidatus Omnitrophota bacterium]|nr:tetratricopeptide repeat protein [Candidatus Omnitrophota bacterium]
MVTFYIASRADLLMAFFMLLSYFLFSKYIKTRRIFLYVFSIGSFALSLLCREMAIILPAFLILELLRRGEKIRNRYKLFLPYVLILSLYSILRVSVLNFSIGSNPLIDHSYTALVPLWQRILTDFMVIVEYLKLLLFPYALHMVRFTSPASSIFELNVVFSIALVALFIIAVKKLSRVSKLALFGAGWFFIGLLPVLNIYPVATFLHEGWLYVPSIGFFIICAVFIKHIMREKIGVKLGILLITPFLAYNFLTTIEYGKTWKDSVSMFNNVLKFEKVGPFRYHNHLNLAIAYFDKGDYEKSIEHYKHTISLNPKHTDSYNNLGAAYMEVGRPV